MSQFFFCEGLRHFFVLNFSDLRDEWDFFDISA